MKKKTLTVVVGGMVLLFLAGIVLLLSATGMGEAAANAALQASGGMATERLFDIMKSTTASYQVIGAVLSGVGGLGGIVFGSFFFRHDLS